VLGVVSLEGNLGDLLKMVDLKEWSPFCIGGENSQVYDGNVRYKIAQV
jgi:hypothetical protein